ncbi:MAG: XRE family transcriptional regulator [Pseudomonadota bacterium]
MGAAETIPDQDAARLSDARALGRDVRSLRKSRNLTLNELALKIGRSLGFVSQVERGISSPSIDDLRAIAGALDVPTSWFFAHEGAGDHERGVIVRAGSRRALGTEESGIVEELLSPDLGGSFEMFRSVFAPGSKLQTPVFRETEEAGYVVSGTLTMTIDGREYALEPGDSFRFDHKSYSWRNMGSEPTIVIWVVSPPVY